MLGVAYGRYGRAFQQHDVGPLPRLVGHAVDAVAVKPVAHLDLTTRSRVVREDGAQGPTRILKTVCLSSRSVGDCRRVIRDVDDVRRLHIGCGRDSEHRSERRLVRSLGDGFTDSTRLSTELLCICSRQRITDTLDLIRGTIALHQSNELIFKSLDPRVDVNDRRRRRRRRRRRHRTSTHRSLHLGLRHLHRTSALQILRSHTRVLHCLVDGVGRFLEPQLGFCRRDEPVCNLRAFLFILQELLYDLLLTRLKVAETLVLASCISTIKDLEDLKVAVRLGALAFLDETLTLLLNDANKVVCRTGTKRIDHVVNESRLCLGQRLLALSAKELADRSSLCDSTRFLGGDRSAEHIRDLLLINDLCNPRSNGRSGRLLAKHLLNGRVRCTKYASLYIRTVEAA